MASILINSTPSLKRINENGIKKMCRNIFAIQQNLTNITMSREADLDHARQYYEIMYQTVSRRFFFLNFCTGCVKDIAGSIVCHAVS